MEDKFFCGLADLYTGEAEKMRRHARKRLPNSDEAEDALQETYRRLAERGTFDGIDNPAALAMGILNNVILTSQRAKYRQRTISLEACVEIEDPAAPDVAEQYSDLERNDLIRDSLRALPSTRSQHLLGLVSLGYKPAEIARDGSAHMGVATPLQIRRALRNARACLRRQFQERGVGPSAILPGPCWRLRIKAQRFLDRLARGIIEAPESAALVARAITAISIAGVAALGPVLGSTPGAQRQGGGAAMETAANDLPLAEPIAFLSAQLDPPAGLDSDPQPEGRLRGSDSLNSGAGLRPDSLASPAPSNGSYDSPEFPGYPAPEATVPSPPDRMSVDTPDGGSAEVNRRREKNHDEPAPSLPDQSVSLAQDPAQVPLPTCWGLEVCGQIPTRLSLKETNI